MIVAVALFQLTPLSGAGNHGGGSSAAAPITEVETPEVVPGPLATALQAEIVEALAAEEWPELTPTMDEAIATGDTAADIEPCGRIVPYDEAAYLGRPRGGAHRDPRGRLDLDGVRAGDERRPHCRGRVAGEELRHVRVLVHGAPDPERGPERGRQLHERKDRAVDVINELQPDIVFITNTYDPRFPVGADAPLSPDGWKEAMTDIVARFQDSAGKIVFLAPPPNDLNVAACYSQVSVPADCISHVTDQWATYAKADAEVAADLGAWYVTSEPWFCVDGACPSFVAGVPTKSDHVHMLPAYADKIAPVMLEQFEAQDIIW